MKKITTYAFVLIASIALMVPSASAASFKDISSTHAYVKEISYLSNLGIINGYSDSSFKPSNQVTNRQAATMIVRALKLENQQVVNPGYKDVTMTDSSYKEIAIAAANGIFPLGEKFSPNEPITREGMARAIANAFKLKGTYAGTFTDVSKSHWAYNHIASLAANNITTGYNDGSFKPKDTLTRAHFSVFLARAINPEMRPTLVNKPAAGLGFYQGLVPKGYKNPVNLSYFLATGEGYSGDKFTIAKYTGSEASANYSLHLTDDEGWGNHIYTETKDQFTFDSQWLPKVTVKYPITVGATTNLEHIYKEYKSEEIYDKNGDLDGYKETLVGERKETISNKVISTNASKEISGKVFKNLIVIEQNTKDPYNGGIVTYYFSTDSGLLGFYSNTLSYSKNLQ